MNVGKMYKGKMFYNTIKTGPLSSILTDKDRCIVQRVDDDDRRYFAFFESWEYFLVWYNRLSPNERKLSEVIREGPQKFRLDIDCPTSKWNIRTDIFVSHITSILERVLREKIDVLVYQSIDGSNKKVSFHVVVSNLYLVSSQQCLAVAHAVRSATELGEFIDMGVYKSLQCFRLEGSSKQRSNRFKYLLNRSDISERFLDGVITNISECSRSKLCQISSRPSTPCCSYASQTVEPARAMEANTDGYCDTVTYNSRGSRSHDCS